MIATFTLLAVLTSASEISNALNSGKTSEVFRVNVQVTSTCQAVIGDFSVEDDSGSVILVPVGRKADKSLQPGCLIRADGSIQTAPFGHIVAVCHSITHTGKSNPTSPSTATFEEILTGKHDAKTIKITGVLRDYFLDEIDPKYLFLIINGDGNTLYAAAATHTDKDIQTLDMSLGRSISITGLCDANPSGCRHNIGRLLRFDDFNSIQVQADTTTDLFAVPSIINAHKKNRFLDISSLGRHKATGFVLATWGGNILLIRTSSGQVLRVDLSKDKLPLVGESIDVVGFPETDLYRINFSRAIWRYALQKAPVHTEITTNITAYILMTDRHGKSAINADFHGRTVRLSGTVRSLPSVGNDGRFYLESDGYTLPVDISANPVLAENLEIGSIIDVTGVCVMDIENWRPNLVFPHIKEVMIVTRTPDDIVVIKRPPWWTPARLMIVIGSLLAALLGILIWNRALKALAEKRGKALANEELERLESDLKVCERTRLAVELHDSIAQNLTGVSMEIDTALRGDEPLPPAAAQHMGRALRTIDSCRGELRNCLWDLRSQALEEEDMNKAIRLTLSQTIGKANLIVRFNVPRSRFTDNTAHTLLRIIRELAANAVRHGHATEIKVAGSIEDDVLKFSVRDNGCGFDPDACPGVRDGHFGLQGVRERVASFEGSIRIESAPGKGTRVSVSINAPQAEDEVKI